MKFLSIAHARPNKRRAVVPVAIGLLGAGALVLLYLGILTLLQSADHALGQLAQDWPWVALVASGFGVQVALYAYLQAIIAEMKLAGPKALTGMGTGTSTVGMIACCAHHITDIAPLIGLTGASGLSGVVGFLGEYKLEVILFGLLVNLAGISLSVRTIRRQQAHLQQMSLGSDELDSAPAPASHQPA